MLKSPDPTHGTYKLQRCIEQEMERRLDASRFPLRYRHEDESPGSEGREREERNEAKLEGEQVRATRSTILDTY